MDNHGNSWIFMDIHGYSWTINSQFSNFVIATNWLVLERSLTLLHITIELNQGKPYFKCNRPRN